MLRTAFALAALLLAAPALAQIHRADALGAPPTAPAADAPSEGIHVNGVWMLTVRNADGSVASRDTVHNALVDNGTSLLSSLLTGRFSDAQWLVRLWESNPFDEAFNSPTRSYASLISTALTNEGYTDENASNPTRPLSGGDPIPTAQAARGTVSASVETTTIDGGLFGADRTVSQLVLEGSVTWPNAIALTAVASLARPIDASTSARTIRSFTFKTLEVPIDVADDQTVDVRVEISFD